MSLPRFVVPFAPYLPSRGRYGVVVCGARQRTAPWRLATCALLLGLPLAGCADKGPHAITGAKVNTWIDAYFNPPKNTIPPRLGPRVVFIDVDALAHRHPAWQLADALEHIQVPLAPALVSPGLAGQKSGQSVGGTSNLGAGKEANGIRLPAPAVQVREIGSAVVHSGVSEVEERAEQTKASDTFLTAARNRQDLQAKDERALAEQELDERVDAARRAMLSQLDPVQLPPKVQEQLVNLRLKLLVTTLRAERERAMLRTLSDSDRQNLLARQSAELEAARAPIIEIETRWRAELHAQADAQAAKVNESYTTIPTRIRSEGEAAIHEEADRVGKSRTAQRTQVRTTREELLERDFAPGSLDLALRLPAVRRLMVPDTASIAKGTRGAVAEGTTRRTKISQTLHGGMASTEPNRPGGPVPGGANAAVSTQGTAPAGRVEALRRVARKEALAWAQLAGLAMGAHWTADRHAPDETGAAVKLLFGGAPAASKARGSLGH